VDLRLVCPELDIVAVPDVDMEDIEGEIVGGVSMARSRSKSVRLPSSMSWRQTQRGGDNMHRIGSTQPRQKDTEAEGRLFQSFATARLINTSGMLVILILLTLLSLLTRWLC
jgi:hypothetical protein